LQTITCPNNGVITGIIYGSSNYLYSIGFICTSSLGERRVGRYGGTGGTGGEERCPTGFNIGSIYGASGNLVDSFGIRCVVYGNTDETPKRDTHGGNGGTPFDDISSATNGRRPVEIRTWSDYLVVTSESPVVMALQVKYANLCFSQI